MTRKEGLVSAAASWEDGSGLRETVMGRMGVSSEAGGWAIVVGVMLRMWVADMYRAAMPRKMRKAMLPGMKRDRLERGIMSFPSIFGLEAEAAGVDTSFWPTIAGALLAPCLLQTQEKGGLELEMRLEAGGRN